MPFLALALKLLSVPEKNEPGNNSTDREKRSPLLLPLQEWNGNQQAKQGDLLLSMLQPASPEPLLRVAVCSEAGIRIVSAFLEHVVPRAVFRTTKGWYQVATVESMSSEWAGISTWDDFMLPPVGRFFHFSFGTPLVLSAPSAPFQAYATATTVFPSPAPLFDGLAQRWQDLGGPKLSVDREQLSAWLHDGACVVSDYALQGFPVTLSPEEHALGFLGWITYTCRGETLALRQVLTALARFAFFAGVGFFHAQGMGTTRVKVEP